MHAAAHSPLTIPCLLYTVPPSPLVGQFGVGFYSAFMVGDSVEVTSRSYSPEEPGHIWKSTGAGAYEIGPVETGQDGRG